MRNHEEKNELLDNRGSFDSIEKKPKHSFLKKLYFIERICQYREGQVVANKFIIGYSLE